MFRSMYIQTLRPYITWEGEKPRYDKDRFRGIFMHKLFLKYTLFSNIEIYMSYYKLCYTVLKTKCY